jgi:hypothetical protein
VADSRLARLIILGGSAAAIVGAVVALIVWWQTPSARLEAEVSGGVFRLPPSVSDRSPIADTLGFKKQLSLILAAGDTRPPRTRVDSLIESSRLSQAYRLLEERVTASSVRQSYDLWRLGGYWTATVHNAGDRTLTSVVLTGTTSPGTEAVCIHYADSVACPRASSKIRIGEMEPGEVVRVHAWTSSEPASSSYDEMRLTHAAGRGKIKVLLPLPSGWRTVRTVLDMAGVIAVVTLVAALVGAVIDRATSRANVRDGGSSGGTISDS